MVFCHPEALSGQRLSKGMRNMDAGVIGQMLWLTRKAGGGRGVVDPVGNVPLSLFPMSQPFEIRSC